MEWNSLLDQAQRLLTAGSVIQWSALLSIALVAGTIGGTVGFGSAVILVPVLAHYFGAVQTVPILTLASLIGNLSRAAFSWCETDWRALGVYASGAVPSAILGSLIYLSIDAVFIGRLLGLFILLMIPASRLLARYGMTVRLWQLLPVGVVMGLLSGVVGTVGPINASFFLAYGLVKGAYLATEALGAAAVHSTKSIVYGRFSAIDQATFVAGLVIGLALLGGSFLGKQIVNRIDAQSFRNFVEFMLIFSGGAMLLGH
jgi:uncharacterized protein